MTLLDFNQAQTFAQAEHRITGESPVARLKETLPPPNTAVQGMKSKGGGEVGGPCPKCGGEDRFFIRADGSYMCRGCGAKGGDAIDFFKWLHDTDVRGLAERYLTPAPAPVKQEEAAAIPENLKVEYIYCDETGAELFRVRRYEQPGRKKTFRQGHYSGGQWVSNLKGVRRVLYHLPEVVAAQQVIPVEGERDVDNLRAQGFVATTAPCGAGKWEQSFTDSLAGKDIAILPDNDDPGRKHAETVAHELLKAGCRVRIVTLPGLPEKGDVSDWIEAGGTREELIRLIEATEPMQAGAEPSKPSPRDKLSALIVNKEYVSMIGKEAWAFENLIIISQIVVIVAKSGGGKSTVSFYFIAPYLIEHRGMTVYYFDCDSPASDHARMLAKVEEVGPKFQWINPLTHGKGPEVLIDILKEFVECGERLDDCIFFLDTLKKFIDMLDKKSVKPFFSLMRQLTALGATIVLLGHANKHRDISGNLVFEGVGDVASDTDALIFFERISSPDGGMDITTVVDPDKGAKVRGLYQPISFHMAPDRTVTLNKDVVSVPDWSPGGAKRHKLTNEEIQELVRDYLMDQPEPVSQSAIVDALKGEPGAGINRFREVLNACAVPQNEARQGQIYFFESGLHNRKLFGVIQ